MNIKQHIPLQKVSNKALPQVKGDDPSPLFIANEVTAGVLCPVLASPVVETQSQIGQSSVKGHKYGLEHYFHEKS